MDMDDVVAVREKQIIVGDDLSDLSLDELAARIVELEAEIERVKKDMVNKKSKQAAANAIFQ